MAALFDIYLVFVDGMYDRQLIFVPLRDCQLDKEKISSSKAHSANNNYLTDS
jgi:hypothetical protein